MQSFGATPLCALVVGSSGAIGAAFVRALRQDPHCTVSEMARSGKNGALPFQLDDEASMERCAAQLKGQTFQLIVDATGALTINNLGPKRALKALSAEHMSRNFAVRQCHWPSAASQAPLSAARAPRGAISVRQAVRACRLDRR